MTVDNEKAIRAIVKSHVESYASDFLIGIYKNMTMTKVQ